MVLNIPFISLSIVIVFILVIILIIAPLIARRMRRSAQDEEQERKANESEGSSPSTEEARVVVPILGKECSPGSICIDGVASALPDANALLAARYVRESVTTDFHPFLIKQDGSHYMPFGSWWLFHGTQDACLGLVPSSVIFLTTHGLYQTSKDVTILLCDSMTPTGRRLTSVFRHSSTLYVIDEVGAIYRLLSQSEFKHHYTDYVASASFVDCTSLSSKWYWQELQYTYGREIPRAKSVTVISNGKGEEVLYIQHATGMLRYNGKRWTSVQKVSYRGCNLDYGRGDVTLSSGGVVLRSADGTLGVVAGKERTLFTLSDGWLIRTGEDVGDYSVRLSGGWVNLISLENGVIIGVSNDVTHALS